MAGPPNVVSTGKLSPFLPLSTGLSVLFVDKHINQLSSSENASCDASHDAEYAETSVWTVDWPERNRMGW